MLTGTLAEQFLVAKRPSWAAATYTNRRYHLTHFADACFELPDQPEEIEAFLAEIPGPLYRYHHWCSIRALYAWAEKRRQLVNPCHLVEAPPKPKQEPYWLEEDELTRLLCHPAHSRRDRALLFVLADTGMRIGEAASMFVENIRGDWVYVVGKTGPRWVPVHPRVMQMLRAFAPEEGPLWRGKRGPLSRGGLQQAVRLAFKRAGFIGPKMSPHRLRHTFATLWTGTDSDGMDVGGWTTWTVWRQYKHARQERIRVAHAEHSPLAYLGLV